MPITEKRIYLKKNISKKLNFLNLVIFFTFLLLILLFDTNFAHLTIKLLNFNIYVTEIFIFIFFIFALVSIILEHNYNSYKEFPLKIEFLFFVLIFFICLIIGLKNYDTYFVLRQSAIFYYSIFTIFVYLLFFDLKFIKYYLYLFIGFSLLLSIFDIFNLYFFELINFRYFYISISLVMIFPFIFYFKKGVIKLFFLIIFTFFLIVVLRSQVRAVWLGIIFAIIMSLICFSVNLELRKYLKIYLFFLLIIILISTSIIFIAYKTNPGIINPLLTEFRTIYDFNNIQNISANNSKWRIIVWNDMIKESFKYPIFGYGFGIKYINETLLNTPDWHEKLTKDTPIDPHNSYISFLFRSGFLGLAAFLAVLIKIFYISFKFLKSNKDLNISLILISLLSSTILILVTSFFMVVLEGPYLGIFLWINLGLILAVLNVSKIKINIQRLEI